MRKFRIKLKKGSNGINAISIVDKPAIEENFVAFSEDKAELQFANDDKMIVVGPALIPDKEIYRNSSFCKGECMLSFDAETINEISELYLRGEVDKKQTVGHSISTNDMKLIETWIIEDSKCDKAFALGLDLPKGTWMNSYKIQDEKLWKRIKEEGLNGYSIEASAVDFIELNLNKQEQETSIEATDEEILEFCNILKNKLKKTDN